MAHSPVGGFRRLCGCVAGSNPAAGQGRHGNVALRKVQGLLDAGASVEVVAPWIHPDLLELRGSLFLRRRRTELKELDHFPEPATALDFYVDYDEFAPFTARDRRIGERHVTHARVTPAVRRCGGSAGAS